LAKNVPFFYLKINPILPFCLSDFWAIILTNVILSI